MRFRVLDSWRGICALLVSAHHLEVRGVLYWQPLVRNAWLFVDFFFVLSGFVIAHAYGEKLSQGLEIRAFVIRRFGRLWPLHVAVLGAFVAIEVSRLAIGYWHPVAGEGAPFAADRSQFAILTNLFLVQSLGTHDFETWNGPSWSISVEFFTYVIFAAVCFAAPRRPARVIVSLLLAIAWAGLLARYSQYGMRETYHWGIARCVYGFFFGTLTYEAWRRGVVIAGTFAEIAAIVLIIAFVTFAPGHGALEYLATPLFCAAVLVFAGEGGLVSRVLTMRPAAALGRWSYSIYMVHTLVLVVLFSAIRVVELASGQRWLIHSNGQAMLDLSAANDPVLLAYLCATIGLAALTWRYIEKPGQQLFGSFVRARPAELGVQTT